MLHGRVTKISFTDRTVRSMSEVHGGKMASNEYVASMMADGETRGGHRRDKCTDTSAGRSITVRCGSARA